MQSAHGTSQRFRQPQIMGRFNGFLKSVILRVNEARDLGDVDRFQFRNGTLLDLTRAPDL